MKFRARPPAAGLVNVATTPRKGVFSIAAMAWPLAVIGLTGGPGITSRLPTRSVLFSVYQRTSSGPTVIPQGATFAVGMASWVTTPNVLMLSTA